MDALQQIAAAVTPAVMVSACGLVALGLDNQISRMSARVRDLVREARSPEIPAPRRAAVIEQVAVLDRRHSLYTLALLLDYGALFAFVLTSLLWLCESVAPIPPAIPVVLFGVGVLALAAMALFVIASVALSRSTIRSEASEVLVPRRRIVTGEPTGVGGPYPH